MKNEEIVLKNRVFLMEQGVIKGTGQKFIFEDENGIREIEVPEEIHTFQVWKKLGYIVKKGEHSIARFPIWQMTSNKKNRDKNDKNDQKDLREGHYYMKVAFFFTKNQVEPIKK
jgi:hypothetical protein